MRGPLDGFIEPCDGHQIGGWAAGRAAATRFVFAVIMLSSKANGPGFVQACTTRSWLSGARGQHRIDAEY